jgi:hypothetical protein
VGYWKRVLEEMQFLDGLVPSCSDCKGPMSYPTLNGLDDEYIGTTWRCSVCGEIDWGTAFVFGEGEVDFDIPQGWEKEAFCASLLILLGKEQAEEADEVTRLLWASRLSRELPDAHEGVDWSEHI